jgi:hypothetical protein
MAVRNPQPKEPDKSAVELAVAALDGNPSPLDMDLENIGDSPTDLDLPLPGKPDDRPDAAGTGAARGGAKGRSLRRKKRPAAALRPKA